MRLNDFGEQRPGEYCTYPAVLEHFIIPRYARETARGWTWTEADDSQSFLTNAQLETWTMCLPRVIVRDVQTTTRGERLVTLPAHYAEWHGMETIEERARQREFNDWGEYQSEIAAAATMDDVDMRYCADSADRYEGD